MEDQSKFFNVIIDRTNQKLNSFQAQIIVLESQLQMANDERDAYKKYVEDMPSLQFNVEELVNLRSKLAETIEQNRIVSEEKDRQYHAVLAEKDRQYDAVVQEKDRQYNAVVQEKDKQYQSVYEEKIRQYQAVLGERERMLTESLEQNLVYIEKIKLLEDRAKDGSRFLQDQNETLLQEIKRLNVELAISRSK